MLSLVSTRNIHTKAIPLRHSVLNLFISSLHPKLQENLLPSFLIGLGSAHHLFKNYFLLHTMALRTPSPNRSKKAKPLAAQTSLLTPGGIRINARIKSNAKRCPYPSRIPGSALALGNSTTAKTEAAPDKPDIFSRSTRSKAVISLCSENPELYPYLIQAEGDITSATTTAAHDKKVIRSWGTEVEQYRHCEDVVPCRNIDAHEESVHMVCNTCANRGNEFLHSVGIPLLTQGPAVGVEGIRFFPLCWGCAEEIVQAEAKGEGQGQQGCRCFALNWCFECKLKELEMSAIRRDMAVERQMCVKGTKEAYEVMVGCFCGSDDVGGGLRSAGCEGVVCLFKKRYPMNDDVETGMHQA